MPADLNDYFKNRKPKKPEDKEGDKKQDFKMPDFKNPFGKFGAALYVLAVILVLFVITRPYIIIHSGEVGIKARFGKYEVTPLQPGFHFFIPFIDQVTSVDTRVRLINYTSGEDSGEAINQRGSGIIRKNSISVLDARNLPVSIDITIQYRLNPQTAPNTIATWGYSWENKIIDPVVRDVVRSIIGKFTAEELPAKRNEISSQIDTDIRKSIDSQLNYPVELLAVQLREIILPAKVKEQIERVQIAKQEAERTKYEVEQANQQALKKAALAKGNAEAVIIEAKGNADAVKIKADADAYSNLQIAASLDSRLLELKQIETQKAFNDALKENKDAKIFLTPGGAVPNIWVDTKDKALQSSLN